MPFPTAAEGYFRSEVPEGRSGAWAIEKIVIPDRSYCRETDPRPDCFKFRPGHYTRLHRNGVDFMTDVYDEWWTQRIAVSEAACRGGEVLLTGLGLGLVAEAVLRAAADRVLKITIIELSTDVINLVEPYLASRYRGKVEIIHSDAFAWLPDANSRFTVVWHDIWPDPYGPAVADEMSLLENRYAPYADWQGCWPREYLAACDAPPAALV